MLVLARYGKCARIKNKNKTFVMPVLGEESKMQQEIITPATEEQELPEFLSSVNSLFPLEIQTHPQVINWDTLEWTPMSPLSPNTQDMYLISSTLHQDWFPVSPVSPTFDKLEEINPPMPKCRKAPKESLFYCDYAGCGRGFATRYRMKSHRISHGSERPNGCKCGKTFARYHDLLRHVRNIHKVGNERVGEYIVKAAQTPYYK